jgi:3-deoxy-D-manno-octulosonic-acid transferase
MQILYDILIYIARLFIPILALFNTKMRFFYRGRKGVFSNLRKSISPKDKTIWMHCASLGEFEQGRPILEKLKSQYPDYKLVLSFFSPSGFEIRKNYSGVDVIIYLPLDTKRNVKLFIDLVHPTIAIFVKYEFWPNLLNELKTRKITTLLVSGIFRKEQHFFKKNATRFRASLDAFSHFFVQNQTSVSLLQSIHYDNVTLSGDTRFDRVADIINQNKELPIIKEFSANAHVLVSGSTWSPDEKLLVNYIDKEASKDEKFIIAPHNIDKVGITRLQQAIQSKTQLYSKATVQNIKDVKVLIIDSIGLLTSIYAYANVSFVGGGFGTGIHNILEPATYGIPIIIGTNYQKFKEAQDLIDAKACFVIDSKERLTKQLKMFYIDNDYTIQSGLQSLNYIKENIGATSIIMKFINKLI